MDGSEADNEIDLTAIDWHRSSNCGEECVEAARIGGIVLFRDGKRPADQPMRLSWSEWTAFVNGVKMGDFDCL